MACEQQQRTASFARGWCAFSQQTGHGAEWVDLIGGYCVLGRDCIAECPHAWKTADAAAVAEVLSLPYLAADPRDHRIVELEVWRDNVLRAGDRLCGEAMQMTVTVPHKMTEQAAKVAAAVEAFRAAMFQR